MNFKQFLKNKLFGGLVLIAFLLLGFYFLSLLVKPPKTNELPKVLNAPSQEALLNPPTTLQQKPDSNSKEQTSTPPLPQDKIKFEGFEGLQEEAQLIEKLP